MRNRIDYYFVSLFSAGFDGSEPYSSFEEAKKLARKKIKEARSGGAHALIFSDESFAPIATVIRSRTGRVVTKLRKS